MEDREVLKQAADSSTEGKTNRKRKHSPTGIEPVSSSLDVVGIKSSVSPQKISRAYFSNCLELRENKSQTDYNIASGSKSINHHALVELGNVDLVANAETLKCPLCFADIDIGGAAVLQECLHTFCKECLRRLIEVSETTVIKCPFRNHEYFCESHLLVREIKSLVSPRVFEQCLQKSMVLSESHADNSFHCKTPNCSGWFLYEGNVSKFFCPMCRHTNCLTCAAIHDGPNCRNDGDDVVILFDSNEKENTNKNIVSEKHTFSLVEFAIDNYRNLQKLSDLSLVTNAEIFKCPTCSQDIEIGAGVVLQDCLHTFCRLCLAAHLEHSEIDMNRCPFVNAEYSCESHLRNKEIKSLLSPEVFERYLQKSMTLAEKHADNSFHCKTPYCTGWCFYEGNVTTFLCPVCKHTNCLTCGTIRDGKNCQHVGDVSIQNRSDESERFAALETEFSVNNYDALQKLSDLDLVTNVETFECPVCFVDIDAGEGVMLQDCLHTFCKECLITHLKHSETPSTKCPFMNEEYSCQSHIRDREIKSLLPPEVFEQHLQKSMLIAESQADNSFHCQTRDCPGWCVYEGNVTVFHCPVCNHRNCLTCAAIHENQNCLQYQDDVAFRFTDNKDAKKTKEYLEKMLKKGSAMHCPKCRIILIKIDGCDLMKCSMCRTFVCWATKGPRWGPNGKDDISGGCRCMINGVRCHPKCMNCH